MGRVDGESVRQAVEAPQTAEHLMRERHRQIGAAQIRPADGADHQRTSREQRRRSAVIGQHVGVVIGRVARSRQRRQRDLGGQLDDLAVDDRTVWRLEVRRRRRDEHGIAACHEPGTAGHVVGMGVRVDRPCDRQSEPVSELLVRDREARRVDDRGGPVVEIDQIRRMTEAFVDELVNLHRHHS